MKKTLLCLSFLFTEFALYAQNGLENIIVEKYYISDANDTSVNADGGVLPIGSVTYRIYADMLPGYKFQAAYGVDMVPLGGAPSPGDHELRIATSTLFFNNEDRGSTAPTFSKNQAQNNTVMLDSWLSAGAACTGNFGIMKDLDDGMNNAMNNDGVLQNNDPAAGIPLTVQDGFISVTGRTPETMTPVGITTEIAMFDSQNDGTNGPVFSTWNGSWASLNGSMGPDTVDNKVLIAQITTDGIFSFELNIQVGTPSGGVENYVAQNPDSNEIQLASLTYNSITTSNTTGKENVSSFTVYPNPAKDFAMILIKPAGSTEKNSYTIYDMPGNVVAHKSVERLTANHVERIDLSSLAPGVYFIKVEINGVASTKKIVKE